MHVVAAKALKDFARQCRPAAEALMTFLDRAEAADWRNITDVRQVYPHADSVKVRSVRDIIVFNLCGNKYRLITAIHFNRGVIYILRFLTHAEYDKDKWKDQL